MNSLTIIGNNAGSPSATGPAASYLLTIGQTKVLIDAGSGSLAGLAARGVSRDVDGIVISHRHADHSLDLVAYAYHQSFPEQRPPLALYGPPGFGTYLDELDRVHGIPTLPTMLTPLRTQFALTEVPLGSSFTVAGLRVDTVAAAHPVPCMSMRFPEVGLVYTADTALTDDLITLSAGADVLLAEATYPTSDGRDVTTHGHMSGLEAGRLARLARAGQLVLTHLGDYADVEATVANARSEFDGPVSVARVGAELPLALR